MSILDQFSASTSTSPAPSPDGEPPTQVVWAPQIGPQKALIDCPFPLVMFGGSRGGGKTDGILGKFGIGAETYGKQFNAVFFRREMPQQDDLIERAKEIFLPLGAQWADQKKTFTFNAGARVRFRPLENIADAEKYQGQSLSHACVEEAGNYADPAPIDRLFGCLRSSAGIPVQLILTCNPGGVGHQWLKSRFIDPAPAGMQPLSWKLPNGKEIRYVYIPSRVTDNKILLHNDPGYVDRLYLTGSPELVRAWLFGDWNVTVGAYYPEFGVQHIHAPCELPEHWLRFRAIDWGSSRPFSVGWYAVSDGILPIFGKNTLIKYREWYGSSAPNVGLKMLAADVATGINARTHISEKIVYTVADTSMFDQDGGPSLAETFARNGVSLRPADKRRIPGWNELRARLQGQDSKPGLVFFSTCTETIRTLPGLQHDTHRPEDVDSDSEDHAADETRYAIMSRPYAKTLDAKPDHIAGLESISLDDLWSRTSQRNQNDSRI